MCAIMNDRLHLDELVQWQNLMISNLCTWTMETLSLTEESIQLMDDIRFPRADI